MTELTVREILKMILEDEVDDTISLEELIEYSLENVDIIGGDNKHLRNPLNSSGERCYFRPRETPLSGNEIVKGDYILYDLVGHNGDERLWIYDDFESLEKSMLSGGGVLNMFTTMMVAIVKGKVKKYKADQENEIFEWIEDESVKE